MKLLLFLFLSSFTLHNYHVSNTLIYKNEKTNTLEITIKTFTDDLDHLEEIKKEESTNNDYNFNANSYIQKSLVITINDQKMYLESIGCETQDDRTYCYYEVHNLPEIITFDVSNSLLFELFKDQSNIIDVEMDSWKKRVLLNSENDTERVVG